MISISACSFSAASARPAAVYASTDSRRVLTSRVKHAARPRRRSGRGGRASPRCGQPKSPSAKCRDEARRDRAWLRQVILEPLARVTEWRSSGGHRSGSRLAGLCAPELLADARLLRAGGLLALRFLALALDAGLLVVLASASLREDAALLDLLVEASQGTLEGLVFAYADFSQSEITSHRRGLRARECVCSSAGTSRSGVARLSTNAAGRRAGRSVAGERGPPDYECISGGRPFRESGRPAPGLVQCRQMALSP